jgi:hypothetical protein
MYQWTQRNIPEDLTSQQHRRWNLKSCDWFTVNSFFEFSVQGVTGVSSVSEAYNINTNVSAKERDG